MKLDDQFFVGQQEVVAQHLEQSPIHLLHRAGQSACSVFQSVVNTGNLTPRQFAILTAVAEKEGQSQTDLVARTGIDRSTLADIVRRLLDKGLLQRNRTMGDARAYAVFLTEDGRMILENAAPMAREVDERILESVPAADRERFLMVLSSIVVACGQLQDDVSMD